LNIILHSPRDERDEQIAEVVEDMMGPKALSIIVVCALQLAEDLMYPSNLTSSQSGIRYSYWFPGHPKYLIK
jgi:hypothetical protein